VDRRSFGVSDDSDADGMSSPTVESRVTKKKKIGLCKKSNKDFVKKFSVILLPDFSQFFSSFHFFFSFGKKLPREKKKRCRPTMNSWSFGRFDDSGPDEFSKC
jgi:hypothetical protein